jgi:hypothetical protein
VFRFQVARPNARIANAVATAATAGVATSSARDPHRRDGRRLHRDERPPHRDDAAVEHVQQYRIHDADARAVDVGEVPVRQRLLEHALAAEENVALVLQLEAVRRRQREPERGHQRGEEHANDAPHAGNGLPSAGRRQWLAYEHFGRRVGVPPPPAQQKLL